MERKESNQTKMVIRYLSKRMNLALPLIWLNYMYVYTFLKINSMNSDINSIEGNADPYQLVFEEFRSHLIRICTIFPRTCTFIIIMESEIQNGT